MLRTQLHYKSSFLGAWFLVDRIGLRPGLAVPGTVGVGGTVIDVGCTGADLASELFTEGLVAISLTGGTAGSTGDD